MTRHVKRDLALCLAKLVYSVSADHVYQLRTMLTGAHMADAVVKRFFQQELEEVAEHGCRWGQGPKGYDPNRCWRARQDGRSLREAAVVALRAPRCEPVTPAFGV